MSALTFPGAVPGVLRRGAPVLGGGEDAWLGVVADVSETQWCIGSVYKGITRPIAWGIATNFSEPAGKLSLDLADRTGRAHLEWWIEEQTGIQIKRDYSLYASGPSVHFGPWFSEFEPDVVWGKVDGVERILAPGLAALRPVRGANWRSDLLPDGSIRDDVDALRIVGLHVAGLGAP